MASIHISEIQRLLVERGQPDAMPWGAAGVGFFLEIRFDAPGEPRGFVDPEYQDKVLSVNSVYGFVIIQFDHEGLLKSIDIS